ncbi:MAG TPA: HPr(Ser) kinase/phosphatase [Verrucomicrobiota bacterium]|jgi:HPr kinase/phosphorylase|nr:HPr(Ser) kinase/phosphatase [Verrucomicrobiota bacterium]OQC24823.1 MAG: HPr kinase/phosphorylase [Verrucomicrobia bacterium ADurb.Bin063]HCL92249.1 HPr(Ser) kinase/phosphatase [Limisphaerales bacterium]HRR65682.1 HPr(Ser) kinase/phosphatase [Candidatus Paceibacterota bacterium]MBP8014994.1 HPr(Ser) kinase/phosphatase [Verrucomicrobiota bacterium]
MPRIKKHDPVSVERFYTEYAGALQLKLVAGAAGLRRLIGEPTVNRPGLVISGFTRYFAKERVQVIGNAEAVFLKSLPPEEQIKRYAVFFSHKVPCLVFSRNLQPHKFCLQAAEKYRTPVFRCPMVTMKFINQATLALENLFAPRGTEMGSMVDILGVGVIIRGESGIGKSESVLALLDRGYSLVADDITKVTLVDGREVMGTSSEVIRDHMEVRGIGIINVAAMFGIKSIRREKRVDLVVTLKSWTEGEEVDRLGLEQESVQILGVDIPHITIPVRPGRDLGRLIEVAAFQTKLKSAGYNAAQELNTRLIAQMAPEAQA